MRISTKTYQLMWLNGFNQRQSEVADIQQQVSTGRRISTAADDPAGAAQTVLLQQSLDRMQTYTVNADTARRRLSLEENALSGATDALNRVRELVIQAGGASMTPESQAALAAEAREMLKSLVTLANSQDGEGRYLFAGNRVQTQPFTLSGDTVYYNGDDGIRSQRIGEDLTVAEGDAGSKVFGTIRSGNGTFSAEALPANSGTGIISSATVANPGAWVPDEYSIGFLSPDATNYVVVDGSGSLVTSGTFSPGDTISFNGIGIQIDGEPGGGDTFKITPSRHQDVFETVQNFIDAMESGSQGPANRAMTQNKLNASLMDLDQALLHLNALRSQVGTRLSAISEQADHNEELTLQLGQTLSTIRDVDYASAITELELQLTGLEAAQKTFLRTQSLSLFNFL